MRGVSFLSFLFKRSAAVVRSIDRWTSLHPPCYLAITSLALNVHPLELSPIPRLCRRAYSPPQSRRWLHLHTSPLTRLLRFVRDIILRRSIRSISVAPEAGQKKSSYSDLTLFLLYLIP